MYVPIHDRLGNHCIGICRLIDNAVIPANACNCDWQDFLVWNARQSPSLDLSDLPPPVRRQSRLLLAIMMNLSALTTASIINVPGDEPASPS